jgi:hypothetical protein
VKALTKISGYHLLQAFELQESNMKLAFTLTGKNDEAEKSKVSFFIDL